MSPGPHQPPLSERAQQLVERTRQAGEGAALTVDARDIQSGEALLELEQRGLVSLRPCGVGLVSVTLTERGKAS